MERLCWLQGLALAKLKHRSLLTLYYLALLKSIKLLIDLLVPNEPFYGLMSVLSKTDFFDIFFL